MTQVLGAVPVASVALSIAPALVAMLAALGGTGLSLFAVLRARGWPVPFIGCPAGLYLGGITAIIAVT